MKKICANCGWNLSEALETGTSGLYFPDGYDIELCVSCFRKEDQLIDETGSNNHPELLKKYLERIK